MNKFELFLHRLNIVFWTPFLFIFCVLLGMVSGMLIGISELLVTLIEGIKRNWTPK